MKIFLLLPLIIVELFVPIYTNSCEDGWLQYENSCYYLSDEAVDWNTAKGKCLGKGSKLAEINDEGENNFLARSFNNGRIFIGITDAVNEGTWIAEISGQPITYSSWQNGEPNNGGGKQNCVLINTDGVWDDVECTDVYRYYCKKTVTLSVESCTMLAVNYTVTSGMANGITYLQGPSESCTRSISGSPSESFSISYEECGLNPSLDSTNSIEITIVVQDKADITSGDDNVYTVKCTFGENEDAEVTFETQGKRKDETKDVNVEVFPNPRMIMYWLDVQTDNFEELSDANVVVLGDSLRQEITLDNNVPNYKVRVKTCSMIAKNLQDVLLKEIPLLDDGTSCPVLGTTYPGFTYLTTDGSPLARVDFKAFLPTLPDVDLSQGVKIVMKCTLSVCLGENSVCDEPSCSGRRRKRRGKRAVKENPTIRNYEDLSEGFIIKYENTTGLSNENSITSDSSEQSGTSLIESTQFWAILISALVVLVLVALITFCIVKYMKKQKAGSNKVLGDNRMSTKMGNLQSFSGRDSWSTSVRDPHYGCDGCSNHICDPRMTHNGPCRREPPPDYDARPEPHKPIGQHRHNYRY